MAGVAETGLGPAAPDFGQLIALQRDSRRRYALASTLLLAVGLAVALAGLVLEVPPGQPWTALGLVAAALAALPWREAIERRDRADGLEVLREEWEDLGPDDAAARERLLALVEAMFGVRRGGAGAP